MKYLLIALAGLGLFLGYVSTRNSEFRYERSGLIQAPPAQIFPYLSNFKKGSEWSPYDRRDPNTKRNFKGTEGEVGSVMEFDGNSDAGTGSLEILKVIPNQQVEVKLVMTRPIPASNLITYTLTPEGDQTRFSWAMSGDGGFMGKLMGVFIDCEKMVAGDFEVGIKTLKDLIEKQPPSP
jgi:uncharacterized protein YndB with AHSA1/START domain